MKRRIVITRETDEVFVIKAQAHSTEAWCAKCATRVQMLTPEAAALASGMSARTIYRLIEAGQIHFNETSDGLLLVCPDSFTPQRHVLKTIASQG